MRRSACYRKRSKRTLLKTFGLRGLVIFFYAYINIMHTLYNHATLYILHQEFLNFHVYIVTSNMTTVYSNELS